MNYIIFDLEATCERDDREFPKEIIEIGAVMVNKNKEIISEFNVFVKPVINPTLTDFCKELTSIRQRDVDNADTFNVAIKRFKEWIGSEPYVLCSWGHYDKGQLKKDSKLHNLSYGWVDSHISLSHQLADAEKRKKTGMKASLKRVGIPMTGIHHRGIDDARNIAKLFTYHYDKWTFPHQK